MSKGSERIDYILAIITIILLVFGALIIASVSASLSQEKFGNTFFFLKHQFFFGIIPGLILGILAIGIPLHFLKKWSPILMLANLILLAMVFLPKIGLKLGGAARWLILGGVSFQPSEFLKLTFIIYLAAWLSGRLERAETLKKEKEFKQTFIAFLAVIGVISFLLIKQPDIGTLGIIILTGTLMYFLAGTHLWHSLILFLLGTAGLFAVIERASYRWKRVTVFLNPESDPLGIGYQIKQALIAVGSGAILGLGFGMSRQKFGFLPQPMSDSIFAVFAEETGFVGAAILVFLFLLFLWRGFKISKEAKDKFSQLAALGISLWIGLQAFINIGSMLGIMPLTGVPLPFISYGGSALLAELAGAGILLNISRGKN